MSALPPDDADSARGERSAAEVDAEFAAIVSGITRELSWDTANRREAEFTPPDGRTAAPEVLDGQAAADERERRRAVRRAQRAEEVTVFEAGRADAAAEMQADETHFVPPEPPPVPRPRRRTVVALLLMALGLVMLVRPSLLQVAPDVVLVLGIAALIGGFGMLVHGLRPHPSDPDDGDGWDDGARL